MTARFHSLVHRLRQDAHPVVLALLTLLAVGPTGAAANAEPPWDGPAFSADPAELLAAASTLDEPEDADIDILLTERELSVGASGLLWEHRHRVYRVLNQEGVDAWSHLEQRWAPWIEARPELRARVLNPDGTVRELDPATITEAGIPGDDPRMFEDTRSLRGPLPGVTVGSVVEIEVRKRRENPYFEPGEVRLLYLGHWQPTRRSRLTVHATPGFEPILRWHEVGDPVETVGEDGGRTWRFEAVDVAGRKNAEPGLPSERSIGPRAGVATGESWAAVARGYGEIVSAALDGAGQTGLLDDLGTPGDDPDGWLAELLERLHERVRYTGVELNQARIVPRKPAVTLERGFGDCKDKSVLLMAALREAGLAAHGALLRTGSGLDVDPGLPGLGAFNHFIVVLDDPDSPWPEPLWIDPTDPYSRPGELPRGDQDRWALRLASAGEALTRTPAFGADMNRWQQTREVYLSEIGNARIVETRRFHGAFASSERSRHARLSENEIRNELALHAGSTYASDEVDQIDVADPADLSEPFEVRFTALEAEAHVTDQIQAISLVHSADLFTHLPDLLWAEGEEPRQGPYQVHLPYEGRIEYRIHLPEGLQVREIPEEVEREIGPVRFERRWGESDDGRLVTARQTLRFDRRELSAEEVETLRDGLEQAAADSIATAVVWLDQSVNARLEAGDVPAALAEAQRLIDLHPDEAIHRLHLAKALLQVGLGDGARREARRAVELAPESAMAWGELGRLLTYDEIGRHFGRGYPREEASKALAKAAGLDPDDSSHAAERAILLEHDHRGRRYAEGADVEEAITVYRELGREELSELGIAHNLAVLLIKIERWDELDQEARELDNEFLEAVYRTVADAMRESPEVAVRTAARLQSDRDARLQVLASASQLLLAQRRYPEAADLLEAGSRLSDQPAELLSQASILRRTQPYEAVARERTPKGLVMRLLEAIAHSDEETGKSVGDLFTASAWSEEKASDYVELRQGMQMALDTAAEGISLDMILDIMQSSLEVQTDGDEDTGLRATYRLPGQGDDTFVLYLIQDEDELRIAASPETPGELAYQALQALDRGDAEVAKRWMDWAHAEAAIPASTEDPLGGPVLRHFWSRGDEADPTRLRHAAWALRAAWAPDDESLERLESARQLAAPEERWRWDVALAEAAMEHEDFDVLLAAVERLAPHFEDSDSLFISHYLALLNLERYDDAAALSRARLEEDENDAHALRCLASLAARQERWEEAERYWQRLIDGGEATTNDLNSAAWLGLGPIGPEGRRGVAEAHLERAQNAASLSQFASYPQLNTLTSLYAAAGRPVEAYKLLIQSLGTVVHGPQDSDWLALGLIAESLDLDEMAVDYYRRSLAESPEEEDERVGRLSPDHPLSVRSLARRYLGPLEGPAGDRDSGS